MRFLALVIALSPIAAAAEPVAREHARCKPGADRVQSRPSEPPRVRPLDEMPDARPVLTVYREVNGCNVLLVREGSRIIEEPVGRPERRRVFRP